MESGFDSNSESVLPLIRYSLIAAIGLSLVSHVSAIWSAIEDAIDEDVYRQRTCSTLALQVMLFANKYTRIRFSLLLLLLIQVISPFVGLLAVAHDWTPLLFFYSVLMLIVFVVELNWFAKHVRLFSLLFHYLSTVLTFLLLLANKFYSSEHTLKQFSNN